MIKLTLTEKGGDSKLLTFDKDEITIGRVSGNDIVLAKGNVSKRHSKLALRGGQIEVSDLKSTNGTFVNGRKIGGPTLLSSSDRVYVGDFLIGIEGMDGAVEGTPSSTSAARRLPPPPPPPPARGRSSAARLPAEERAEEEDDVDLGGSSSDEEEELAARPPSSGRVPLPPPPPPPPPRRPPTPLVSRTLLEDEMPPSTGDESGSGNYEDTGAVGLFAHSHADEEVDGTGSRRATTGARPVPSAPGSATGPLQPVGDVSGAGIAPGFEALLADPTVTHILVIGPDAALIDRGSGLKLHPDSLGDPNAVADTLWRYANTAYPPPPPDNPVVDVRLPDGTRISAAFPPAAPSGVVGSIRRPGLPERALADLIPGGSQEIETLLEAVTSTRRNLLITGDAAAVNTTLGALAGAIPADRRVVAIGALARGRSGWTELSAGGDVTALVRVAAALRADHLVLGDLNGPEAGEIALVAARGQEGLIVAFPGRGAAETLNRLSALASAGLGSAATAAALIAGAFDLVLHVATTADDGARVVEIGEPRCNGAEVTVDVGLSFQSDGGKRDLASGRLQGRGLSARLGAAVAAAGGSLPAALVGK
jgi:pilus assembly protein CpaF